MKNLFFALLIVLGSAVAASAGTITEFVLVENGNFGANGDGFNTYAMRVTADTDWTNSDMSIALSAGTLNHVLATLPIGGMGPSAGVNGFGDTAVFGPTTDLGNAVAAIGNSPQLAASHEEGPTSFKANWFNTATTNIGTFDIAMISVSEDAVGELKFRTIAGTAVEEGGFTIGAEPTFQILNGAIVPAGFVIPEPTTLALAGLALAGVIGTRRRS